MMKLCLMLMACLGLTAVECAVMLPLGLSVARIDVAVAVVLFLALRSPTLEGAMGSFAAGFFVDVLSGQPSGLYVFTAVLTFLLSRLAAPFVDVRSAGGFALLAALVDALHNFAAWGLVLLAPLQGAGRTPMLAGIPLSAVLTALASLAVWPLFLRIEGLFRKPDTGLLR
jgi:rod shape-determining protein MreD